MRVTLVAVVPRPARSKDGALGEVVAEYVKRTTRFAPCEEVLVGSVEGMFGMVEKLGAKGSASLILLDSGGQSWTSEQFAEEVRRLRDTGVQQMLLGIGPADGWSDEARGRADRLLSLGRMTLPHQLARVVLAEQVYRAFTILAGHPYHLGH